MTTNTSSSKRKKVDWDKKNNSDSERIKQRAQKKKIITDKTDSNIPSKLQRVPLASGQPLLRLRQKIHEIYDEEDENDNIVTNPLYFNIELVEDMEKSKQEKILLENLRQTKEQELTDKMNTIMSTALAADKAGLKPKMTKTDAVRTTSAEYNPQKLERQTIHDKIEKPLRLNGNVERGQLSQTVAGIRNTRKMLSPDSLTNLDAKEVPDLADETNSEDLAKVILKKAGRKGPKKSLLEIAEGLNKYKDMDNENKKDN